MSVISTKTLTVDILLLFVFVVVFFLAAGTVSWLYGWIFLILFYGYSFWALLWMLKHNPGLIEERAAGVQIQSTRVGQGCVRHRVGRL